MKRTLTDLAQRCFAFATAAALALCIGSPPAAAQDASGVTLAVLPFENNSGDAEQDFFAGGMTDEIAAVLSRISGLGVVARSSSFQLKPSDRNSQAAGKALNAGHIVQGMARMTADRVQLSIRLMRSSDGARLWCRLVRAKRSFAIALATLPSISISCAPRSRRVRAGPRRSATR